MLRTTGNVQQCKATRPGSFALIIKDGLSG